MQEKQGRSHQLQDLTRKQLQDLERKQKTKVQLWLDLIIYLLPLVCGTVALLEFLLLPDNTTNRNPWVYPVCLGIAMAAYVIYAMVKDGTLKCIRSQLDSDFADRVCCVMVMNGTFVKENPTIAKKVAQAVQKAHAWMRDNSDEATKVLMDKGWNGGNYEMNIMINNSLQFGLSDEFTESTLKDFISRYVRLGLITSMDDEAEILDLAWTPVL